MSSLGKISDAMERGEYDGKPPESKLFPPLLERAHARKQEAVEADGLRWQLEKKENEVLDLKKALRVKAEEVSEMQVRKDLAEKRLHSSGKEGDERLIKMQQRIEEQQHELKKKER